MNNSNNTRRKKRNPNPNPNPNPKGYFPNPNLKGLPSLPLRYVPYLLLSSTNVVVVVSSPTTPLTLTLTQGDEQVQDCSCSVDWALRMTCIAVVLLMGVVAESMIWCDFFCMIFLCLCVGDAF
jgi:hypothetical protein